MAIISCLANDINYASIFEAQLAAHLSAGDVVIGISASGNSPNVLRAMAYARRNGAITIGLIGSGGGQLKELTSKSVVLSSQDSGQIESIHSCLAHLITCLVRERISSE